MNNVKKSIGWADYTINPVKGLCPVDCKDNQGKSYCYARRMYKRFKWNPEIRYDDSVFPRFPSGSRVFIGSTMELFGSWVKPEWLKNIFADCQANPNATFIFLTKQPQNLPLEFPPNCWVGFSLFDAEKQRDWGFSFVEVEASVKFLSFEPLLNIPNWWNAYLLAESFKRAGINWVIIGCQTPLSEKTLPKIEWIMEIVEACDKAKIPIFIKNNLMPLVESCMECGACAKQFKIEGLLLDDDYKLRQEFPK